MSEDRPPARTASDSEEEALTELATRVFDMARRGDTAALEAYLDAGLPANLANHNGDTLLMLAAYHGHSATVERLCARGADPDRRNDRGQSPLAGAVFKGEDAVVRTLLARGADPDAGTPSARESARMFAKTHLLDLFDTSA